MAYRMAKAIRATALFGLLCSSCGSGSSPGASRSSPEPTPKCTTIFDNYNGQLVQNNPNAPTGFVLNQNDPNVLCWIDTYHWNNGNGKAPGTIGLRDLSTNPPQVIGPFNAAATAGQFGNPNVNWRAPAAGIAGVPLKAGSRYEVVDSDKPSWSWNQLSNSGFAKVWTMVGG